jgi:hypothetical protein
MQLVIMVQWLQLQQAKTQMFVLQTKWQHVKDLQERISH